MIMITQGIKFCNYFIPDLWKAKLEIYADLAQISYSYNNSSFSDNNSVSTDYNSADYVIACFVLPSVSPEGKT